MPVLLSAAYFPPMEYFAAIAADFTLSPDGVKPSVVYIEGSENYQKQSWRNRCRFYADSGPQYLTFPVVHEGGTHKLPIRGIRVDYSLPWVRQHQRAIVSAYRMSAYFEYYQDELFAVMDSMPETLFDLDISIIRFFLEKTGIPAEVRVTDCYRKSDGLCQGAPWGGLPSAWGGIVDLRGVIHPKRPNDILGRLGLEKPYFQVFSRKHGFFGGLSIMDLLFNEGPDSILWLKRLSSSVRNGSRL